MIFQIYFSFFLVEYKETHISPVNIRAFSISSLISVVTICQILMNGVNENYLPNSSDLFECLKSDLLQLTNELFNNWYKTYTYYLNEKDSRISSELILNEYGDIKNDLIGYFNERDQYWIDVCSLWAFEVIRIGDSAFEAIRSRIKK